MKLSDVAIQALIKESINDKALEEAKEQAAKQKKPLQDVLLDNKVISEKDLTKLYADNIGAEFISLSNVDIEPPVLNLIPEHIAREYRAVLFEANDKGKRKVAISDPGDLPAVDALEKLLGKDVHIYIATDSDINKVLDQYKGNLDSEITKVIPDGEDETTPEEISADEVAEDSPIAKTVNLLIEYAIKEGASDIHIEPREQVVQIRYRVDGVLREANTLPRNLMLALVSRIKIMANLKIDEHRKPQDGRFKIQSSSGTVALRVSTLPTMDGEKVVMRLLDESSRALTLKELGFGASAYERMERAMHQPHGMILVTGPTGSGKSTTLYSILTSLNSPKVNISTVEDPVEYRIQGVNQTQVNPKAGMTFASGLRALLRQDPNIIMVGEIRDSETADLAIQAALTGHLVLSTLHTNNAATTLPRLLDMEAEPFLIASTVRVVIGQRLVRKICQNCRISYQPDEKQMAKLNQEFYIEKYLDMINENLAQDYQDKQDRLKKDSHKKNESKKKKDKDSQDNLPAADTVPNKIDVNNLTLYKAGEGCDECDGQSYKGRLGIYEVLEINEAITKLIVSSATSDDIQHQAIEDGMMTMQLDGFIKAVSGYTTVEEILRVTRE